MARADQPRPHEEELDAVRREAKEMEAALRESEERYKALFERMLDGFALWEAVIDPEGEVTDFRLLEVNPAYEEMTGAPGGVIVGKLISELLGIEESIGPDILKRVCASGAVERAALYSGRLEKHFEGVVFRPQAGRVATICADVTGRRRLEAQLRQAAKLEALGTLAGGVAHEINNPVNIIMNYAELISREVGKESRSGGFAQEIVAESKRIAEIVRNLLAYARAERETYSETSLEGIISSATALASHLLTKDQIDVRVEVEPRLPPVLCRTQQILQVLMNLLTNARDALNDRVPESAEGKSIWIRAGELSEEGHRWVRVSVEDNGAGVSDGLVERVFDPFFTTKATGAGTGLGLSVSHGIIEDHGGRISVESALGEGTCFHVDLPVFEPSALRSSPDT